MKKPVIFAILLVFAVVLLWGLDYLSSQAPVISKATPMAKKMMAVYDFKKLTITDLPKEYNGKMISIKNTNDNKQIVTVQVNGNVLVTDKLEHHHKLILECTSCDQKTINLKIDFQRPDFHEVKRGQVLSRIGEIYGIKVEDIKRWNNMKDYNTTEGEKLRLEALSDAEPPVGVKPPVRVIPPVGVESPVGVSNKTLEQLKQEKINLIPADHPQKALLKGKINGCQDKSCVDKITF